MSKFSDVVQALIDKIKKDVPDLGEFKPTVFVVKADGNHEVLSIMDVTGLVVTEEDIDDGNIPELDDLLVAFVDLLSNNQDAYDGVCLGALFVGIGRVRQADPGNDKSIVDAALSFHGRSVNKEDNNIMLIYQCMTNADGKIVSVNATALDFKSICETPPPASGTSGFHFGMN